MINNSLSYEFIRGLIVGEGCFTFCSAGWSEHKKVRLPTFALAMSNVDKDLIYSVKETLRLRNKVYEYGSRKVDDLFTRRGMIILMVRDIGQLKNIIIPLCYKKLHGYKLVQFEDWINKIGNEFFILERYRFIYKIYKAGFYEKIHDYD